MLAIPVCLHVTHVPEESVCIVAPLTISVFSLETISLPGLLLPVEQNVHTSPPSNGCA